MKRTCTITATAKVSGKLLAEKSWTGVDIMRTGHTRGWCTRMLNVHPQDHVRVSWECRHDQPAEKGSDYRHRFEGSIVRIQGGLFKTGICECW